MNVTRAQSFQEGKRLLSEAKADGVGPASREVDPKEARSRIDQAIALVDSFEAIEDGKNHAYRDTNPQSGEISSQFYYKKLDASYQTNKADGSFSFVEVRREDDDYSGPTQTITAAEYDGNTLTMVQNWSDAYSETVTTSWKLSPEGGTRSQVERW